jgi:hypothetical protein
MLYNTPASFYDDNKEITKAQANEFMRDLRGTMYAAFDGASENRIVSVITIANVMEMNIRKAYEFCEAMVRHGITQKVHGMYVV